MKLWLGLIIGLLFQFSNTFASPRVSVTEFKDETAHWDAGCKRYQWGYRFMQQLKSSFERELSSHNVRIMERQHINKIYQDEYKMENLNEKTKQKANSFLAAQYAVTGAITEFGVCEEESEGGISLGNIVSLVGGPHTDADVNARSSVSRAKLIAKVVSVRTGEVIKSFEAEAHDNDLAGGVSLKVMGIGGHGTQSRNKPYEKVANKAIQDLAEQVASFLNSRS